MIENLENISPAEFTVLLFIGFILLFIFISRYQTRIQKEASTSKPIDVLPAGLGTRYKQEQVLVGCLRTEWKDASLDIRDYWGRNIAVVTYGINSIHLSVEGNRYEIANEKRPFLTASISTSALKLRMVKSSAFITTSSRYEIASGQDLTVAANFRAVLKSDFRITRNGQQIGQFAQVGHKAAKQVVLWIADDTPLVARAFIMALEYRRLH
jgi:hypothetical protein